MGDVVDLHGQPLHLGDNEEFVRDCCRFFESLLSEATMKRKWKFSNEVWERLGSDEALIEAVEAEKIRRMRDGSTKREKAQQLVIKAPDVLSGIMLGSASDRHKIDAAKTLNDFSDSGRETATTSDKITITINLGPNENGVDHVERYSKTIAIDPIDANDTSTTLEPFATITAED